MQEILEESTYQDSPEDERLFKEFLEKYANEKGKTIKEVSSEEFDMLYSQFFTKKIT